MTSICNAVMGNHRLDAEDYFIIDILGRLNYLFPDIKSKGYSFLLRRVVRFRPLFFMVSGLVY